MPTTDEEWAQRIARVVDHIEAHLAEPLTRDELARVAAFSPYHFHRVFLAQTGETLFAFILRLRLERGARRLLDEPTTPVLDVALDLGFSSASTFARSFKAHFGLSATAWRKEGRAGRNPRVAPPNLRRSRAEVRGYLDGDPRWSLHMPDAIATVRVTHLPRAEVAYARAIGDYFRDPQGVFGPLFGELERWAVPRGHLGPRRIVFHDDPDVTESARLRVSVAVEVPAGTEVRPPLGRMVLPGGAYAHATFRASPHGRSDPWQAMFGDWLPVSGFVPDERPAWESHEPAAPGQVTVFVPVRPR